jgi:hypothetical protein
MCLMSKEIDPNTRRPHADEEENAATPLNNPDYANKEENNVKDLDLFEDEGLILKKLFKYP